MTVFGAEQGKDNPIPRDNLGWVCFPAGAT
jgi:hypothetical protein